MRLGVGASAESSLAVRLAWLLALRLLVVTAFFGILTTFYLGGFSLNAFSGKVALITIAGAYAASAVYAAALRRGRHIPLIAFAQLVTDQLTWTSIVYISGGPSSGAVSLYGLTCLSGAILLGLRGAMVAALAGASSYALLCAGFVLRALGPPPDQPAEAYVTSWSDLRYPFLVNLLAIVVVTLLASYLAERLRLTGGRLVVATERAEQAERLAAMGRLAAGLAHEIRNPLGSIAASIELLRTGGTLSVEDRELCSIVERETARLNDLVGDMLDLSRPRAPSKGLVDVAVTAADVVVLASRSGRGADVRVRYEGPESALIFADAAQIRQVVWNLVRNAIQASSASDEVLVRVSSGGGERVLEVRDRGQGISPEARERLFDAFFTTRSQGMGIGLAVVKRILDDHGFGIEVESVAEQGTVFRVRMPVDEVAVAELAREAEGARVSA
ncbi:MAG TPA: ATP-binding protein [Polyangiaceae bacterium]|nr:ATP-binding protein [Polyangiaceae bacterium]